MYKNENAICADVILLVNNALSYLGIENWYARQNHQPTNQTLKNGSVFVDFIMSKRVGWQKHKDIVNEDNTISHIEEWEEEVTVQLSAYRKRDVSDTIATVNSGDVIKRLAGYFQGYKGLEELHNKGYGITRITDIRQNHFENDSDEFENMPSLDIVLILVQNELTGTPAITNANITLKGV